MKKSKINMRNRLYMSIYDESTKIVRGKMLIK